MMQDFLEMKSLVASLTWEQFLIELTRTKIYLDVLRNYRILSSIAFFWIGCNIGSFLNVCIYRLPLGMSLFHPKSHCPKCGHKLSFYENIPLFSWLFLCGSCKECGQHISCRYWIVELITGCLFTAVYLKTAYLELPFMSLLLYFYLISIVLTAAFTDCDLRVIPNALTIPALILVPAYWLLYSYPFQRYLDWESFIYFTCCEAGTIAVMSVFALLGRLIFKRDAFGWGDVKYLGIIAGALGWFPVILIVFAASVLAIVYMPLYWCFRPKRKRRGFAFAPFMTIFTLIWCLGGPWIHRYILMWFRGDI